MKNKFDNTCRGAGKKSDGVSVKSITYMYYMASIFILFGVGIGGVIDHVLFDVAFLVGALMYLFCYLLKPKDDDNIRLKRLENMNVFAGMLFTISSVLKMGWIPSFKGLWILFFALAVVFVVYAFVIVFVVKDKKELRKK